MKQKSSEDMNKYPEVTEKIIDIFPNSQKTGMGITFDQLLKIEDKMDPESKNQRRFIKWFLEPSYRGIFNKLFLHPFRKIIHEISEESLANLPIDENFIIAGNHADRWTAFNIFCTIISAHEKYAGTELGSHLNKPGTDKSRMPNFVIKDTYFNKITTGFLIACSNIPQPSRSSTFEQLINTEFGKKNNYTKSEAALISYLLDNGIAPDEIQTNHLSEEVNKLLNHLELIDAYHTEKLIQTLACSFRGMHDLNFDMVIFPGGTRSVTNGKGFNGVIQNSLALQKPIVPTGFNNGDIAYPGWNLFTPRTCTLDFRLGEAIYPEYWINKYFPDLEQFVSDHIRSKLPEHLRSTATPEMIQSYRNDPNYLPFFTKAMKTKYGQELTAATEELMLHKIDPLLDPRHQRAAGPDKNLILMYGGKELREFLITNYIMPSLKNDNIERDVKHIKDEASYFIKKQIIDSIPGHVKLPPEDLAQIDAYMKKMAKGIIELLDHKVSR